LDLSWVSIIEAPCSCMPSVHKVLSP